MKLGALDAALCELYEKGVKEKLPHVRSISYDVSDLYSFLDNLQDISCLVFSSQLNAYLPRGREWIKQQLLTHLQQQSVH